MDRELTPSNMAVNLKQLFQVYKEPGSGIVSDRAIMTLCSLCDARIQASDHGLCEACVADLPHNQPACPGCSMPTVCAHYCPACLQSSKRPIERIYTIYRYHYPVDRLIQAMKFQSQPALAYLFGKILVKRIQTDAIDLPDCLIPVPLHRRRLAERGFNQARIIAQVVAAHYQIPLLSPGPVRNRHTRAQTALNATQRRRNVAGAFRLKGPLPYKHVAIVDDVVTSGATVAALARSLRAAGAERVDVWACARAGVG